jgi:hypothetical protein
MARTVAEAVAAARRDLGDTDSQRVTDGDLRSYALDAVNMVRNGRPDLFLGNWGVLPAFAEADPLPLDDQFFRPVVDFMVARASVIDDEHINNGRAELMAKAAGGFLS